MAHPQNLTNDQALRNIQFKVLNEAQCARIYGLAVELLGKIGWTIGHDNNGRAKKVYQEAGCIVDGDNIKIPAHVIEDAIAVAPKHFYIYDQKGNPAMEMDAYNPKSYIFTAANPCHIFDVRTGQRRESYIKDAYEHSLVQAALPNIDIPCGMTWIQDCPEALQGAYETREMLRVHTKPVAVFAHDQADFQEVMKLCYAVAGGKDKFVEKPFGTHIGTINTADFTMDVIESGAILLDQASPLVGAKSPATLAGTLVQGLAENLATLVLAENVRPGYPYVGCIYADILDFRSLSYAQTAPEMFLQGAAGADLFRYLGLPTNNHLGGTDSPIFDQQAAFDISNQLIAAFFSGVNISGFSGLLEGAMGGSILNIIYADEVAGYLNTIINGVKVDAETLSGEIFERIGFEGDFISETQTFNHMKDFWLPETFVRQSYDQWEAAGSKNYEERAREKALAIIEKGIENPKSDAMNAKLDDILAEATAKVK